MTKSSFRRLAIRVLTAASVATPFSPALAQSDPGVAITEPGAQTSPPCTAPDDAALVATYKPTLRALVVLRGGCIVYEYYRNDVGVETKSPVYSVTKSILSILVGIAVDEGYIRLDESLAEIMPDAFGADVDPRAKTVTVRDLLTMTSGFSGVAPASFPAQDMWRWMLYRPIAYEPGAHFAYDGPAADLLGVVLSRAIKQDAEQFAKKKLFQPLAIDNYTWPADYQGHLLGDSHLYMTARDMAKIGLLYLHGGRWGDRQIVSEQYVRDSTTKHSEGGPPTNNAYGYLWWLRRTNVGEDAFLAAGRQSQLIYVVPKRDIVVAMSAESIPGGSQRYMDETVMPGEATLPSSTKCIAGAESQH
jgi:CubicO group peptidase (beta-lactamase class C family)